MKVLVITHGPEITPGWLTDAAEEAGVELVEADLSQNGAPVRRDWDRVVVLGGHMGAYEEESYPWLAPEKGLLKAELAAGTPILGVCLGSQLLADVIGGSARRAPDTEIGFIELQRSEEGSDDPVLAAITGTVVSWHHDTFDLPPGARVLASTAAYPHAFRHGSALGVQFHPEVTPAMWETWIETAGSDELEGAGIEPAAFQAELEQQAGRLRDQAVAFFRAWFDE